MGPAGWCWATSGQGRGAGDAAGVTRGLRPPVPGRLPRPARARPPRPASGWRSHCWPRSRTSGRTRSSGARRGSATCSPTTATRARSSPSTRSCRRPGSSRGWWRGRGLTGSTCGWVRGSPIFCATTRAGSSASRTSRTGERHRLDGDLVVGSDGRNSKVRQLSSLAATELNVQHRHRVDHDAPPREDPALSGLELIAEPGSNLAVLGQGGGWQIGFTIVAGTFGELRAAGVEPCAALLRRRAPWLGDRIDALTDPNQLTLLPIRITRVEPLERAGPAADRRRRARHLAGRGQRHQLRDRRRRRGREPARRAAQRRAASIPRVVDAATAEVERVRRPSVDREQAFQVRVERATARRLAARADPRPALALRVIAAVPGLARWSAAAARRRWPSPPRTRGSWRAPPRCRDGQAGWRGRRSRDAMVGAAAVTGEARRAWPRRSEWRGRGWPRGLAAVA